MLIVSGRGQVLAVDEPERHLAGECWRDDWAVILVSAVCPFSGCVFVGVMVSAAVGVLGGGAAMASWVAAWLHADCVWARAGTCTRRA